MGPIIKLLGPIVSVLTSIGATASSVGRVIMDVVGVATAALGTVLQPALVTIARFIEFLAKGIENIASAIGGAINPIKALFNASADAGVDGVNSFFDNVIKGAEGAGKAIDGWNKKWAQTVLNNRLANMRDNMRAAGASEKQITEAQANFREAFNRQMGLADPVELRSLKLPPEIMDRIEARDQRLGIGASRALAISKEWAEIKQKAYQNEIRALEQGLTLMNKQKELAEAMSAAATARRALEARGYELGVQVAASPEGKAAAEARLADLKLRQEREAISERRGILQTERELQQRQMIIQEKQIRIQQEQLKIQVAEGRAEQVRAQKEREALLRMQKNTKIGSPEWSRAQELLNINAAEQARNNAKVDGSREALRLAFEAEGQLGTLNGLERQRLGLQEQQLAIQAQSAQYTHEQQALLAQISQAEQKIANDLTRATNEQNRTKSVLDLQTQEINRQNTLLERQGRLEKAKDELAATRAKAQVQTAQRLADLQELQDRARSGGGTTAVIEAQIAAAAAGVSGMETAAQVQERLYQAREQQMAREHELQRQQMRFQHDREASEVRIQKLQMESQRVAIALQRAQLGAEIAKLTLQQRRDAIAPQLARATSVPGLGLGGAYLQGNIGPTSSGPHFDVKKVGGGFFPRNYLDQFVEVNGKPLSSGITVRGGTFFAHQKRESHGWDYAFGDGRFAATLKGGAQWMEGKPTEHGERRRFRLPTGEVFQFLHGRSEGIGTATAATGASGGATVSANPKLQRIMQAARAAGFQGEDLIRMTAVAMAESSGNARAFNDNPATGDLSYGAWQVNMRGAMGPARRQQFGLANNERLFDLPTNARVAKAIFDTEGIRAWGSFRDGSFQKWMGQARAAANTPGVATVGTTVAAAGGTVAPSTANQAQGLQQNLQDLNTQDVRIGQLINDLTQWQSQLGNILSLQQENLTEQQLAEREQFEFERRKSVLAAQVMQTPEGRLAMATGDAVSGSISGSLSGALQALLSGGDVKQAVGSALAQAGQALMQATLDALLNPVLSQLQGGIVKAITGIDVQGTAQQVAAASLQTAAGVQQAAATQTLAAAQALFGAASALGAGGLGGGASMLGTMASKIPNLLSGFSGLGSGMDFSAAFNSTSDLMDFGSAPNLINSAGFFTPSTNAFTQGMAGGGEIQYGLDYLVGERNAEIVRFNKAGGRVFSNRALTKALGVPFQRTPGGGSAVADGGNSPGGMIAPTIPFLKSPANRSGPVAGSSALKVSVDTQVINGIEYATVEQMRQAAVAAAEAGRNSVYNDLRNNPSVQRSLGMGG